MEIKQKVEELIEEAIQFQSSDIFFLPKRDQMMVCFRQSNSVKEIESLKNDEALEVINFLKYAAQTDISEHRRPQVGAMTYRYEDQDYYLRLSSVGDFTDQESLVIRIIYNLETSRYFYPDQLIYLKNLAQRRGLIITSGPTGSGKTTTMYELAKEVGAQKVVMTIEDPVEIHEKSFLQSQVNSEAAISYESLLKAALRHRPDILIIGEIRDSKTARVAIDAALSGHLVLATVHAKSTLQTISRLEGLKIRKDELANCLTAVSYQRLLPTNEGVACLLDMASGKVLQNSIEKSVRGNFINWQENLQNLYKGGEINDETYQLYQEG